MLKPKFFKLNIQLFLWSLHLWAGVPRFTLGNLGELDREDGGLDCGGEGRELCGGGGRELRGGRGRELRGGRVRGRELRRGGAELG